MIAVIDYGSGNLRSVQKALEKLGQKAVITADPAVLADADRAILPGQGAFADCMNGLAAANLTTPVLDFMKSGRPFLGICVGMQLLFEKSYEFGEHAGLGILPGEVMRFPDENIAQGMKIPHMGWNTVEKHFDHPLLDGISTGEHFYFVHSYYVDTPETSCVALSCTYGPRFAAMVVKGNIAATQFHPEKSQKAGVHLLENFSRWTAGA